MGNDQSKDPNFGYRCVKIAPGSPAEQVIPCLQRHLPNLFHLLGWIKTICRFYRRDRSTRKPRSASEQQT